MADSVTIEAVAGIVVAALGGQEGIKYLFKARRQRNGNGYVSKEFCNERTGNMKETVDQIHNDIKIILKTLHNQ